MSFSNCNLSDTVISEDPVVIFEVPEPVKIKKTRAPKTKPPKTTANNTDDNNTDSDPNIKAQAQAQAEHPAPEPPIVIPSDPTCTIRVDDKPERQARKTLQHYEIVFQSSTCMLKALEHIASVRPVEFSKIINSINFKQINKQESTLLCAFRSYASEPELRTFLGSAPGYGIQEASMTLVHLPSKTKALKK